MASEDATTTTTTATTRSRFDELWDQAEAGVEEANRELQRIQQDHWKQRERDEWPLG